MESGGAQLDFPAKDLEPAVALGAERVGKGLARVEVGQVDAGVLMDGEGAIAAVGGGDGLPAVVTAFGGEGFLVVGGLMAFAIGEEPDLVEVDGLGGGGVEFAVEDARAGGNALDFARAEDGAVPEAVLVLEGALENPGDNFHVTVRVHAEALPGGDAVFVHDAQGAEAHVVGIVVIGEREGMAGVKPAVVGVPALGGRSEGDHGWSRIPKGRKG